VYSSAASAFFNAAVEQGKRTIMDLPLLQGTTLKQKREIKNEYGYVLILGLSNIHQRNETS
jgi:hypothetical protein